MYKVVFSKNFVYKHRRNQLQENHDVYNMLSELQPGTEINVHTKEQTFYNAAFLALDHQTKKVSILTDRFYKDGNNLTTLDCSDITSIDIPVDSLVAASNERSSDDEDE
jgi:hypothetical protein